ncbi:hypothetical protein [Spirillospora sp. CA-294931]|uniref:hypothetical protein n=1 Tax=Spirillospora sp. CA-294931 TaxID=3240042 RepID=UPI003D9472DD
MTTREVVVTRLTARFSCLSAEAVRRCVDDLCSCCSHLGESPDAAVIERLAVSRLTGVVKGCPPDDLPAAPRRASALS